MVTNNHRKVLRRANQGVLRNFKWFVEERHRVYLRRHKGLPQDEWTSDRVLANQAFCNAFRVLDRGSQFVLTDLDLENQPTQIALLRVAAYRFTNQPSLWRWIHRELGYQLEEEDIESGELASLLDQAESQGRSIFRPAYLISFGRESKLSNRQESLMSLLDNFRYGSLAQRAFLNAGSLEERMQALQDQVPRVGRFMAQQIATDMNYFPQHALGTENDHVLPGPGSLRGLSLLFGAPARGKELSEDFRSMLEALQAYLHHSETAPQLFPGRSVRRLSLMDLQNCLCEFSKYMKYSARAASDPLKYAQKKPYRALATLPGPVLPAHWADESPI